jgi:hypothetical protein
MLSSFPSRLSAAHVHSVLAWLTDLLKQAPPNNSKEGNEGRNGAYLQAEERRMEGVYV